MQLNKGDKCRVRLIKTGEVVDAVYNSKTNSMESCHHVIVGGVKGLIAIGGRILREKIKFDAFCSHECIFVGPSCEVVPNEN